jgi:hypothetical protein
MRRPASGSRAWWTGALVKDPEDSTGLVWTVSRRLPADFHE